MGSLKFVGKAVTADPDLVYRDYVSTVKQADLSAEAIDQAINNGFSGYAANTYVDTRDGLLATQAYIDGQDNLRLKLAQKNVADGIAGLDATGKVPTSLINAALTQKYFRGPWSPASYGSAANFTTEATITTIGVTDPGYAYKLVVFGQVDSHSNSDTEYPVFRIREGNATTGQIIAVGNGPSDGAENFGRGDSFDREGEDLGDGWAETYFEGGSGAAKTDGSVMYWDDNGNDNNSLKAYRVDASDRYTGTDLQRIVANMSTAGESRSGSSDYQYLRIYMRVNDAHTQYVCWQITESDAKLIYNIGSGEVQLGTTFSTTQGAVPFTAFAGDVNGNKYSYYLFRNTTLVGTVNDPTHITSVSPSNRGWGFGLRAGARFFGQTTPPRLSSIVAGDVVVAYEPTLIVPKDMTARTGSTTLYVRALRSGASSTGSYNPYKPKLHVLAIPA